MKITALEEYGLRCMISLALCENGESLTLPEISEQEGISLSYAGKLLMILRKQGLVVAERGRNGGYNLSRPATSITLSEIFNALGEPLYSQEHCLKYTGDKDECVHKNSCSVKDVWKTLSFFISEFFDRLSLEDVAKRSLGGSKTNPREIADEIKTVLELRE